MTGETWSTLQGIETPFTQCMIYRGHETQF